MSSNTATTIRQHDYGTVYQLTVTHADRMNVLNTPIITDLRRALDEIASDAEARVVVLRGDGDKAWIGGADIREMAALDNRSARDFITRLHLLCHAIRQLPVPVVARISGFCLGAGLEVAACCDLRLAALNAQFGMPEVQIGIPSVIEAALLTRLIGVGATRDLVLTGRTVDADQAERWGLIERPVELNQLDRLVETRVEQLLSADSKALALQKSLCLAWEELPMSEAIEKGIDTFTLAYESPEPNIRMQAFLDRKRH